MYFHSFYEEIGLFFHKKTKFCWFYTKYVVILYSKQKYTISLKQTK